MSAVISVEGVSKQYRLGEVGTGTLSHDINRWWHRVRGKEDPYLKIGETNDRTKKGCSEYAWALRDISFEVKQGEVLGIIGRNGAGKSTLLKILSRVTSPTAGRIKVKGRIASLLEVGTGFHPELTGRENIYLNGAILGMRRHEITAKFDEIVEFSGCERYIDTPVKRYSSGMYVRLAFAVAAHLEPEILIVDEVLAVGDAEFQRKCLGKIKDVAGQGRTVLFVSHNLATMRGLCRNGVLLDSGSITFSGPIVATISAYHSSRPPEDYAEFPARPDRPSITHLRIIKESVTSQDLVVEVGFKSPFQLNRPVPGIVISSPSGTPILGTNTRFDPPSRPIGPSNSGTAIVRLPGLNLHDGSYRISAWLGDWENDYDERADALSFEIQSDIRVHHIPDANRIGHLKIKAEWELPA